MTLEKNPFLTQFPTLSNAKYNVYATSVLLSANAVSLDKFRILSFSYSLLDYANVPVIVQIKVL